MFKATNAGYSYTKEGITVYAPNIELCLIRWFKAYNQSTIGMLRANFAAK